MSEFCGIIQDLGEILYFDYEPEPGKVKQYEMSVCLTTATEAAYNVTDREYLFKGDLRLPDIENIRNISGMYFKRKEVPDTEYMFLTAIRQLISPRYRYVFAVQINSSVDLCIQKEIPGKPYKQTAFEVREKGIRAYCTTIPRSQKPTQDGTLDQTIFTCMMPAKYKLAPGMRIRKNNFVVKETVKDGVTTYENVFEKVNYKVESVDTSLTVYDPETKSFTGVISAQLSEDLRADKTIEPPEGEIVP